MNGYEVWNQIVSSPGGTDQTSPGSVQDHSPQYDSAPTADTDDAVGQHTAQPATTAAAPQPQRSTAPDLIVPPAEDDLPANLTIIARHAVHHGADCCIVWLLSEDGHHLQPIALAHRDPHHYASLRRRLQPMPVHNGSRPLVESLGTDHVVPHTTPTRKMCLPLSRHGQDHGIVEIIVAPGTGSLAVRLAEEMQMLANQATLTIENARLHQKLAETKRHLRDHSGRLLIAREQERKRIAYDIHDGFAQFATSAHQHLQAVAHTHQLSNPETRRQLSQAMALMQQAILEARAIIADVPPPTLYERGLAAAIQHQVVELTNNGRGCTFEDAIGGQRFAEAVELALFRTAQEALTNICRHAGPTPVRVTLTSEQRNVCLVVRDWGCGFREGAHANKGTREHIGVRAMRDRITSLGGWITIDSILGEGTCIAAMLPASTMDSGGNRYGNQHTAAR